MEGFDEHWNFMGTQNTATYTNLDPGNYILLFRGTNSDGIWNPEERILGITIIPPVWKTRWFIIFTVTIAILITFLLIRSLFIFQRNKSIREKEMIELQLKTIKSQIDPHFAFNAINTIASFIFTDKPDVTYDYFTRFARMIRNILEDNEKISKLLSEEVNFVQNYLELQKMRFRDKFDYTIEVDEQIPADTQVPKMIIQSYAENAIKHGLMHRTSGGLLTVSVKREDHDLILVIEDNGIGREKAARLNPDSTHRGFRIMERTLELYCRLYSTRISQEILDLKDAEGNATGTRVILKISLQEKGSSKRKFNISKIFFKNGKG
jgi:LytS/YehU family sensor histidine kinase